MTDTHTAMLDEQITRTIDQGTCPDCGHRGFILGPRGGSAVNIECGGCGARFNVTPGITSHHLVFAHRIPSKSDGGADWS
jgi:transcription elongation factor Elf1